MPIISDHMAFFMRLCVPYAVMLLLFILSMISFSTPLSITIEIPFIIIMIYYWSIYRPTLLPPLLLFMAGICIDFLSGMPAGLSPFIFLIMRYIICSQRLFLMGQPFMVIWFGFSVVGAITLYIQWALFGLINLQWTPLQPVILSIISGILLLPIIIFILNLSHKVLPILPDQYSAMK